MQHNFFDSKIELNHGKKHLFQEIKDTLTQLYTLKKKLGEVAHHRRHRLAHKQ